MHNESKLCHFIKISGLFKQGKIFYLDSLTKLILNIDVDIITFLYLEWLLKRTLNGKW